ncbi:topoisomerase DNA-binding C4 zinc finger domain-containing protein [Vibrio sp. SS-MA-C1-2]|uniref:DNA topoisomerase family protein n=1 Tax=Vibrio sp. SS-MA-C1-2 TaxID=2908646 RepID=UPI001F2B0643|nr:type I DNA topoisomerase [Vibrio sp. SS-MA-C1-2]UJF20082.1 topoisomerase DNA-binding C4 zinc finger domain-containing protein [Vibrio sp. SS-MA-C1-2]
MSENNRTPLFSMHEHALNDKICPVCQGQLSIRHGKNGPFLGCENYPSCHYIGSLNHNDGHIVKELDIPCPECQQYLVLRQGRYGMFVGCSAYPECHHIEPIDKPDETEIPCPVCHKGELIERKSRYGKRFYACNCYPKCQFAINFKPVLGHCQECGFGVLMEKKLASGMKLQCADKKCHHYQTPESSSF